MRRFNPLGLLALLSIIAVLGFLTDNKVYTVLLGAAGRILSRKCAQNSDARFFRQPAFPHCLRVSLLRIL